MHFSFNGIIVMLLTLFVFSGCQDTHKEKVKKAVKKHIKEKAGKNGSYKVKGFGKIDTIYQDIQSTTKYQKLTDTFKLSAEIFALKNRVEIALPSEKDSFRKELKRKRENLQKRRKMIKEYEQNYDPNLIGYWITHSYMLKDSQINRAFMVDTAYKVVTSKEVSAE